MSLREKGKARRESEVVTAAASLWRDRGVAGVTLADVAEAAELSVQTIYNLIGGLEALKIAVIEGVLERLEQTVAGTSQVGIGRSIERVRVSASLFLADPALYRPS